MMDLIENIAIAMWQEEVDDYPAVRRLRNEDTWQDEDDDLQYKWRRYAKVAWEVIGDADRLKIGGE